MTLQKLLFAINHKATEDAISEIVKESHICVGAATYKESVVDLLKKTNPDILIIRETLQGTIKMLNLISEIRIECPTVRIIFISFKREKDDLFLESLVNYGIYDIINQDIVTISEIISYILNPRTFRDVSQYLNPSQKISSKIETVPDKSKNKKSLLSLFNINKDEKKIKSKENQLLLSEELPQISIETMRIAIQEEAERKAQADLDKLIKNAVDNSTTEFQLKITEQSNKINELTQALNKKINQESEARETINKLQIEKDDLIRGLEDFKKKTTENMKEYDVQIKNLKSTENPKWYSEQLEIYKKKENDFISKIDEKNNTIKKISEDIKAYISENENLKSELKEIKNTIKNLNDEDYYNIDYKIDLQEIENTHTLTPNSSKNVIVCTGVKSGIGNSTIALNTAIAIAKKNYKTLFIEINKENPILKHYFDYIDNIGLDTACQNILENNIDSVEASIIKPYTLTPENRHLLKIYRKFPASLHFIKFSDDFLLNYTTNIKEILNERALKDLFYYFTMQLKYSYIIIDIPANNNEISDIFLKSGFLVNKLLITLSQDIYNINSAGNLIKNLASDNSLSLIKEANYILNHYNPENELTTKRIAKYLSINYKNILKVSADITGYANSAFHKTPYILSKTKFSLDYENISNKLLEKVENL